MKPIEMAWEGYRELLPADAPEVQLRETRQAFYGGAAILFEAIMGALDPGEGPTERDMRMMSDIQKELRDFGQKLDRRYFGKQEH